MIIWRQNYYGCPITYYDLYLFLNANYLKRVSFYSYTDEFR